MLIELLKKKNYLAMIRNTAKGENNMFRNVYALVDGQEKDIVDNGDTACGLVAAAVLYLNKLISDLHTTVSGTVRDMEKNGWQPIEELKEGAVLLWEEKKGKNDGVMHHHLGFYLGDEQAMSNGSHGAGGVPVIHHYTYNGERQVEKIYWHPSLD